MTWFCTQVNLPSITAGNALQQTPFIDAPVPGDKMVYGTLDVTFLLDEQLLSLTTIQDWMKGITFPEDFNQYANLGLQQLLQMQNMANIGKGQYSDAMLTILSNKNNPIFQVQFIDAFPVSISAVQFDTALSAENIMTGSASFKFTNYDITRVTTI
jgi:hypothetical protein